MCYKKNKSLFEVRKIFLSEIGHFEHDHRYRFSREMGNITSYKKVRLQKLLNSGCQDSICFDIFEFV